MASILFRALVFATLIACAPCVPPTTVSSQAMPARAQDDGRQASQGAPLQPSGACSVADLVERVHPAVVGITAQREVSGTSGDLQQFFERYFGGAPSTPPGGSRIERGSGSGFIVEATGLVVTNHHVVDGAEMLTVRLSDGKELSARLKGGDAPTDLAIIELIEPPDALPTVELGDSDALRVGDCVVAIGDPFGLELTVTRGIISAKARELTHQPYDQFLQTDAAINPGNSGGPLFDLSGKVVGINTAIVASAQGIGFAVPVNLLKTLLPELESRGRVVRGYLGIVTQSLTPPLAEALGTEATQGALVAEVAPDSPAQQAGLRPGDLITHLQGKPIDGASALSREVAALPPGERVELSVIRDRKDARIEVTLGERPDGSVEPGDAPPGQPEKRLGVQLQRVPEALAQQLGLRGGALIAQVDPNSRAAQGGLAAGDVVVEANGQAIASPSDLVKAVQESGSRALLLRVFRRGQPLFVAIPATR